MIPDAHKKRFAVGNRAFLSDLNDARIPLPIIADIIEAGHLDK